MIQSLDTPEPFPEPIEFIEWPLLFGGIVVGAIWVGVGRPHLFLKLSAYSLGLMLLFYLSVIEWLGKPLPWDQFYWIGVLGSSSTLILIVGVLLLPAVSIPLLVGRLSKHSGQSRLSIAQLLSSTTCFALTISISVTWFPSTDWLAKYFSRLIEFLAAPSALTVFVMPAILNVLIAYMAIVCLLRIRAQYVWILLTSFVAASLMTFVFVSVTKLAIAEFDASLIGTLYMIGQTLVSILAIYFLLDFVFNNDNNCSDNLQDDSEDNSK